jgi:RNA polymerase sigma-B factor
MSATGRNPEAQSSRHGSPPPRSHSLRVLGARPHDHDREPVAAGIDLAAADTGVLFVRWMQYRDERARETLVERFLPLARRLARRYARSSAPDDDLVQVASLGLVKAIDRFDPARGLAFSSYASPTILGELKRYFRDRCWAVHVPRGAQERAREIEAAGQQLASETGRSPSVGELAQYLGLSHEEALDGLETAQAYAAVSLNAPRPTEDENRDGYLDSLGEEDRGLALVDTAVTVNTAIRQLPRREQRILHLRFVEDLTQREIAERIGVSQMQVSRLLCRLLQSLRELTVDAQPCE